jgi:hypothetical protein
VEPSEPIVIEREIPNGYEVVPYHYSNQHGLVPYAAALTLDDLRPGHYIVSWRNDECIQQDSPTDRGTLLAEFTMTEEAVLPSKLGKLTTRSLGLSDDTHTVGEDSLCRPVTRIETRLRTEISLTFPEQWLPWAGVVETAIYIDGAVYSGFSPADSQQITGGRYTKNFDYLCAASDGSHLDHMRFAEGTHRLQLAVKVGHEPELLSNEATFRIDCGRHSPQKDDAPVPSDAPGPQDTTEGDITEGGCLLAHRSGNGQLPTLLLIILLVCSATRPRKLV